MNRRWLSRTLAVLAAAIGLLVVLELGYERTDAYRRGNRVYYRDGRATRAGIAFARSWSIVVSVTTPVFRS